jgi:hypothetical protein
MGTALAASCPERTQIETLDRDGRRWLRGRRAPQGRFNAGQKVNASIRPHDMRCAA